jgi:exopolyphosphatase/guanosine-5'-triphosphate,3'-diphosphate pyrophosphatase
MMRASIDIGTNTIRMLIGDVEGHSVNPEKYLRQITRIGGDFDPSNGLHEMSMERTLAALEDFSGELEAHDVNGVYAIATEALRRAPNKEIFIERVKARCGFDVEIIDGDLEAELSCAGVLSALKPSHDHLLIFDIGGGSTEFIYVVKGIPVFARSYPLGTVMLCEHHPGEIAQRAHIDRTLRYLHDDMVKAGFAHPLPSGTVPVGTAGTVTTLAALDMEMQIYDWRKVNNYVLSYSRLMEISSQLAPLTVNQRESLPGMEKGRGDLVLPGARIVESVLDFCESPNLVVSDFGLLEGALLRAAGAI